MQEQLTLLAELQQADRQLQETEEALAALPARLQSMKDDVSSVEALLENERQKLRDVQAYRADLDQTVQREQEQLSKTKAKLTQIRTSKEYMAVQREFDTNRRQTGEREQEIGKLSSAIETTEQSIAKHEEDLQALQKQVDDEATEIEKQIAELGAVVAKQRETREQTSDRVQRSLLRKYDQIRRLRGGVAVVPAVGGVCTGCRMHLPPQLYNILHRRASIEQCPNCQRIVFFETPAEDQASAEAAE